MFAALFTWDIDPILIDFGPLQIRYYGLLFAATIYAGFFLFRREAMRAGRSPEWAERFLMYMVLGVVLGSRLGHCLFYEPERYLAHPIEILYFWKGGLASHGATLGIFFVTWLFARRTKDTFLAVADMLVPAIAFTAGGVRIGNFFNSEIVGRAWDGPWSVVFARYDRMMGIHPAVARHPTAFYEVLMGFGAYWIVMLVKKRDIRRDGSGLALGAFLISYFSFRFIVEFFKEYQVGALAKGAKALAGAGEGVQLTMGQYLSIAPVIVGMLFVAYALRQPKDAVPAPVSWEEQVASQRAEAEAVPRTTKRKGRKKR